jgi:hypothetical protein
MLGAFTKPLLAVAASDILEVCAQAWPEDYQVEFKGSLPVKKGNDHPWMGGAEDIGEHARDEILSELVGFANSQGGTLILGVTETREKPPRAHSVEPLPRIGDLARRFEDQARSCIDPPLAALQIRSIDIENGRGVIVFRTNPSHVAPHRLTTTRNAYVRRGSSTMKMTMREIQNMTLDTARGLAGIEAAFEKRQEAFQKWAGPRQVSRMLGCVRITALPLQELPNPGRLLRRNDLFLPLRRFRVAIGDRQADLVVPNLSGVREDPILRGVARHDDTEGAHVRQELSQRGGVDLWLGIHPRDEQPPLLLLYHGYVLGAVANVLALIDNFRASVGFPGAEYGLEVEIARFGPVNVPLTYVELFSSVFGDGRHVTDRWPITPPRISVGSSAEFDDVLNAIDVDIFDSLGVHYERTPMKLIT